MSSVDEAARLCEVRISHRQHSATSRIMVCTEIQTNQNLIWWMYTGLSI